MALAGPQISMDLLKIVTDIFGATFISLFVQFWLVLVELILVSSDKTLTKNKNKNKKTVEKDFALVLFNTVHLLLSIFHVILLAT